MKAIISILFLTLGILAISQTPGNLGTSNITAWFNPASLTNGNVTSWTTTYPTASSAISVEDLTAPYPEATETPAGNVSNYNRTIEFLNNDITNLKALENTNNLDILDNRNYGDEGTFFCAYYLPTSTSNDHLLLYNESGGDGLQLRNLNTKGRIAIGANLYTSSNASNDWNETFEPSIISYRGNRGSSTAMETYTSGSEFTGGVASQSSGAVGLYMGIMPGNNNSPLNGYVHEYIFYDRDLSEQEIRKVHTYLAIKYGVTLINSNGGTEGDYESTNGTNVWDASINPSYHNDVIGIARDDAQGLLQKQSHSFDDTTRVYLNLLNSTNLGNTGTINNDNAYLLVGHNNDPVCGTISALMEAPTTSPITSRIAREWKITNSNFNQAFNLDIKLKSCALPTTGEIANLRLLVDDDGDFSDADVLNTTSGLQISYSNGIVTIQNIDNSLIPVGSTKYITLGYESSNIAISLQDTEICLGDSTKLIFNIDHSGTENISYSDGTNTYNLTNVSNGDFVYVSPNSNTSYQLAINNPFTNCCNVNSHSNPAELIINQLPIVTAIATLDTICYGGETTLFGQGANSYSWSNGIQDFEAISPNTTTEYVVTGQDNNQCTNSDTITITVAPQTTINLGNDTIICPQAPLILSIEQNFESYLWHNGTTDLEYETSQAGEYSLTVSDIYGCNYSDTIQVELSDRCSETLYVPNVFTPNGDGNNDTFFAYGMGIQDYEINIYNRWGNLIYTSDNIDDFWDGKDRSGQMCSEGVYVYAISYTPNGINYEKLTGHITLIK